MKNKTKKILVGIDYSKSSDNALNYALKLASKLKAEIILFHVFDFPVVQTYSGLFALNYKDVKNFDAKKLEVIKQKALKKQAGINISVLNTSQPFDEAIKSVIAGKGINYVVLGLATKNKISKMIYGTHGVDVASKIDCPLIIVPEKYTVHNQNNIAVCVDNQDAIKKKIIGKALKVSADMKAKHQLVHIKTEDEFFYVDRIKAASDNEKWGVKVVEASDFNSGLKQHLKKHKADAVVIFSHSHSPFYKLFNNTHTKSVAFNSNIPVISIHAK